jgi:cyanophycinase
MKSKKGKLIIIGGKESKGLPDEEHELNDDGDTVQLEILKTLAEEATKHHGCIEIITTASKSYPVELGRNYRSAFKKLGFEDLNVMDIRDREEAFKPEYAERVKNAKVIMFSGGDQLRLSTILGGTPVLSAIYEQFDKGGLTIAGTSAGAMVMSNSMIIAGESHGSFYKGGIKITSAFGFIPLVIIDTHFIERGRFGRLAHAVAINPAATGIGLEEDTAVVVSEGDILETIGSGNVIIIDGHTIRNTNIIEIKEGEPISIESLTVHVMSHGDTYSIQDRKFTSAIKLAKEEEKKD